MENQSAPNQTEPNDPSHLETPPEIPQQPIPKKPRTWTIPLIVGLFIVAASMATAGYFAYENFQLKQEVEKVEEVGQVETVTQSSPTPPPTEDPFADWEVYRIDEIGLSFKLPQNTNTTEKPFEIRSGQGDTGLEICATYGATEIFVGCDGVFALSVKSNDYSAARGAMFTDYRGYLSEDNLFYALGSSNHKVEIPVELTKEIITTNGLQVLRVQGKDSTEGEYRGAIGGTPGDGNIGALINIQGHDDFDGISVFMKLTETHTVEVFDQILSTFELTDQTQTSDSEIDTSNWQTYTNTSSNFSIKYPPEWTLQNDIPRSLTAIDYLYEKALEAFDSLVLTNNTYDMLFVAEKTDDYTKTGVIDTKFKESNKSFSIDEKGFYLNKEVTSYTTETEFVADLSKVSEVVTGNQRISRKVPVELGTYFYDIYIFSNENVTLSEKESDEIISILKTMKW